MTGLVALSDPGYGSVRFSRKKYYPAAAEEAIGKFVSLFHRYGYIFKPMGGGGWISADEKWQLSDTEILKAAACANGKQFIGARAGRASKFAVIDIDAGSKYHNLDSFRKIKRLLAEAGIAESQLYQSSESGGWHLYIFFDSPISSRDLRQQLYLLFKLHDFEINKGTLEIFPHVGEKSLAQGLRLPLQPGWAWLNEENLAVSVAREDMFPAEALESFIADMECQANSHHQFHQLKAYVAKVAATRETIVARTANASKLAEVIPIRKSVYVESSEDALTEAKGSFQKLPPGLNAEVWVRGRNYYFKGLTGPSQRADATFCLSHYFFYGDPANWISAVGYGYEKEREWLIKEVLQTKNNGQSKDIDAGRSDGLKQAERAASWLPPRRRGQENGKYVADVPIAWQRNNSNRAALARKKIAVAVEDFEEAGQPFSMRDLRLKSGCGVDTLYKHQDLWKAAQERLQNGLLAGDPDEYNAVVQAACSESKPADQSAQKIAPAGLLAARRIVYELKMRDEREQARKRGQARRAEKASENRWRDKVKRLMEKEPGELPIGSLKVRINSLVRELPLAPSEEEYWELLGYLESLREELAERVGGRQLVMDLYTEAVSLMCDLAE